MSRVERFDQLADHPMLGKLYGKLTGKEIELARFFLKCNEGLDKGAFEYALNRMFLDQEKPKNWAIISELLICANSAVTGSESP